MDFSIPYELVQLVNGTFSIRSVAEDETFHPVIGPVAEAQALYVRQLNLVERMRAHTGDFVIWDIGLGAAANVLTVLRATRHISANVRVLSFDRTLDPLRFGVRHATELGYFDGYEASVHTILSKGNSKFTDGAHQVMWQFLLGDFPTLIRDAHATEWPKPNAILFDAFSPAKNPEMWTQPLFAQLFKLLDPEQPCALPTYSRSTLLRVSLLLAGFYVGAGHATGEKEETTIASNNLQLLKEPLDQTWLARARRSTSAEPLWEPVYGQRKLSETTWERLKSHPQFHSFFIPRDGQNRE